MLSHIDLFRLFGDPDRLRLLALCREEELTVGELSLLLGESQPQITKKTQPLRDAGLLLQRRDGTRTLLRTQTEYTGARTAMFAVAIDEGRALCGREGSLARIPSVVAQREEASRRFFADRDHPSPSPTVTAAEFLPMLSVFAPLLPGRALALDVGAGDGSLLPLLSPLFDRVIAVDRSPARLAACAIRVEELGLGNIRLREGDVDDADLAEEVSQRGGADIVLMSRVLHHAARPSEAIAAAVRLTRRGGHLLLVDYLPHGDESMREQGDVWLGFEPERLREWLTAATLDVVHLAPLWASRAPLGQPALQLAVGRRPSTPT